MIDQVTPVVKEMFSFMESSSSATAASASSAWPEDLPERRSLPPVLCRTRSPANRGSASHRPSDGVTVTRLRCLAKTAQRGTLTQDIAKFGHRRLGWRRMGKPAAAGMNPTYAVGAATVPHACCWLAHASAILGGNARWPRRRSSCATYSRRTAF